MLKHREKLQKIIASIMILVTCTFAVPNFSQASIGGKLFSPVVSLFAALGDTVIGALQYWMLGTSSVWSTTLEWDDPNVKINPDANAKTNVTVAGKTLEKGWTTWDGEYDDITVPNIIYSPELIFSNLVPALDINFLNPKDDSDFVQVDSLGSQPTSSSMALHEVIAAWYAAFRNIALVGLLSVLVYIGIRIVISSSAGEKSQYKERIMDWLVALCLLFVMQYIMSFTINITEQITKVFSGAQAINVHVVDTKVLNSSDPKDKTDFNQSENDSEGESTSTEDEADFSFTTNFMGYMRFLVNSGDIIEKCAYLIVYLFLVVYTVMFTFIYLKRVLYMAFFTMIAPLVALTYPLDKISDGKAQAFNLWLREYIFNALIQPMHLALYTMLMSGAMQLATSNPIYALVATYFLFPAEKFVKKMFGFDKAQTPASAGSFAGGALTMALINRVKSAGKKGGNSSNGDSGNSGDYIDRGVNANAFATAGHPLAVTSGNANQDPNARNSMSNGFTQNSQSQRTSQTHQSLQAEQTQYAQQNIDERAGSEVQSENDDNRFTDASTLGVNAAINTVPGNDTQNNSSQIYDEREGISNPTNYGDIGNLNNNSRWANFRNRVSDGYETFKERGSRRASHYMNGARKRVKNAPRSVGRFALKYGTRALKGVAGAGIAAIPAGVTLLATGDVGNAAKIVAAGAGAGAMIGPDGLDAWEGTKKHASNFMAAGRTYSEQKEVEAKKKVKAAKSDKKQMNDLEKALYKSNENLSAADWLEKNKDIAKEYYKNGVKNAATIYKTEKLAKANPNLSKDYKMNLAKQYDNIGKRINDPEFMQAFNKQLEEEGLQKNDRQYLYRNLRFLDDF